MKPSVLIPIAPGTNRDRDLALAFELAGATATRAPMSALEGGEVAVADHQIVAFAGGFSYGDALGAGHVWGLDVGTRLGDELRAGVQRDQLVIGICNGFQALVASGLLPGPDGPPATLRPNANGRFECRWVSLRPQDSSSPWLSSVDDDLRCPVAHGEGRFVTDDAQTLRSNGQVALTYVASDRPAEAAASYPANPNGSTADIAGITDPTGRIFGLMPHPENHVLDRQDPLASRSPAGNCLPLFQAATNALCRA